MLLRLPIVENVDAIGLESVIGRTNSLRGVNAISAGPIKTLAARGIANFSDMLKTQNERAPLKRNVDVAEVGATAAFLLSSGASGITGETIFVDCGYNIMGF